MGIFYLKNKKKKSKNNEKIDNTLKIKKEEVKTKEKKTENQILIKLSKYIKGQKEESKENIYFEIKDIENNYIKLENEIQQISLAKICNEEEDSENLLEKYLKKLKNISENARKIAFEIKKILFNEFQKRNPIFVNLKINKNNFVDPGCIYEFSSWCKNNIKDENQICEDLCRENKEENYEEEDLNIFIKLTKIYLQCELCNENIEFKSCDENCNFDKNQMYDLAEVSGINKKVKFYILQGLFYNGKFIKNGKIHVFAYSIKDKKNS
jgi:hypothetical protein